MYKLVVSSGLLLAVIATAFCYDFEDSYFNAILATDLEETQRSLDYSFAGEHSRARREAGGPDKCRRRRFRECCDTEFMAGLHDRAKASKKECFRQVYGKDKDAAGSPPDPFKCDKVNKHRRDMTCFVQCMAEKGHLVGEDGSLKDAQFTALVRENFKEAWLVPHLNTILSKCLSEARNATADHNKNAVDACNPSPLKGFHCLFVEVQMTCPEEQIKDLKACSKFREGVKKQEKLMPVNQILKQ